MESICSPRKPRRIKPMRGAVPPPSDTHPTSPAIAQTTHPYSWESKPCKGKGTNAKKRQGTARNSQESQEQRPLAPHLHSLSLHSPLSTLHYHSGLPSPQSLFRINPLHSLSPRPSIPDPPSYSLTPHPHPPLHLLTFPLHSLPPHLPSLPPSHPLSIQHLHSFTFPSLPTHRPTHHPTHTSLLSPDSLPTLLSFTRPVYPPFPSNAGRPHTPFCTLPPHLAGITSGQEGSIRDSIDWNM
jgi:hypothetical protein